MDAEGGPAVDFGVDCSSTVFILEHGRRTDRQTDGRTHKLTDTTAHVTADVGVRDCAPVMRDSQRRDGLVVSRRLWR